MSKLKIKEHFKLYDYNPRHLSFNDIVGMPSNDICMPLKRDNYNNCLALDLSSLSFAHMCDGKQSLLSHLHPGLTQHFWKMSYLIIHLGNETDDLFVRHFSCTEYS